MISTVTEDVYMGKGGGTEGRGSQFLTCNLEVGQSRTGHQVVCIHVLKNALSVFQLTPHCYNKGSQILLSADSSNPSANETHMTVIDMLLHHHIASHLTAFIALDSSICTSVTSVQPITADEALYQLNTSLHSG